MIYLAAITILCGGLLGFVLTLLTLPGIWLPVIIALIFQWWHPEMFNWWTIGAAVALGVLAEVLEFLASAAGAAGAGGSKRSAVGAVVGTVVGAIVGSLIPLFPITTIIGAVAGAGLGAALIDRSRAERTWAQSGRVGAGAAAARGLALLIKACLGTLIALLLVVGALAPRL